MPNTENRLTQENLPEPQTWLLDACGLCCPLPLLKMKQKLNQIAVGDKLVVKTTDPGSQRDFQSYIDLTNHQLTFCEEQGIFIYTIIKN
ncbi:sulfurtransferase TusA family protein [Aliikangiella maris]|uniref:Sulfurtransferase TusA family protein n=2 Tax=Aliikangiella maris TaxID=3162458 RepID=A0ABV2BV66_9GAMM